jgi:hypothetical protein
MASLGSQDCGGRVSGTIVRGGTLRQDNAG